MTNDAAPDTPLLQVDAITKTFGGFTALDNISVDIRKGERFGLIGPNGSGKTTLINCISGALRPQTGSVLFCGEDITQLPPHLRARRGIARSFQIPRPFKSMTVLENLMVGLDFATVGSSLPEEDVAMSILTRMGLAAKAGAWCVSPFIGRLDDISQNGMELIRDIVTIYRNYQYKTKVLVASVRSPQHVVEAAKIGGDICTMPYTVYKQLVQHPLTDSGLKKFLADWDKQNVPKA